jgi:hypothetical protein
MDNVDQPPAASEARAERPAQRQSSSRDLVRAEDLRDFAAVVEVVLDQG